MRLSLRLVLAGAIAAAVAAPAAPAAGTYCPPPTQRVCTIRCQVHTELGLPCPR